VEPPQATSKGRDKAKSQLNLRGAQGIFTGKFMRLNVTHFTSIR
jgi:hypothetical protein